VLVDGTLADGSDDIESKRLGNGEAPLELARVLDRSLSLALVFAVDIVALLDFDNTYIGVVDVVVPKLFQYDEVALCDVLSEEGLELDEDRVLDSL